MAHFSCFSTGTGGAPVQATGQQLAPVVSTHGSLAGHSLDTTFLAVIVASARFACLFIGQPVICRVVYLVPATLGKFHAVPFLISSIYAVEGLF